MRKYAYLYFCLLLAPCLLADNDIQKYAKEQYGDKLKLTEAQANQLNWVEDNPVFTPEAASRVKIHPEIPRALSRLYNLQRLRGGSKADYEAFIAPQVEAHKTDVLSQKSFDELARNIQQMSQEQYAVLEAASIISGVTLSDNAKKRAKKHLEDRLPPDSTQFLSETVPYADTVYPLAHEVIKQYPVAKELFPKVFLPDSHLRHMLYNEGSSSMYSRIEQGITKGIIKQNDLDLWYNYWVANIAGFRGHEGGIGSLYLTQHTFNGIAYLYRIFQGMLNGQKIDPMKHYLEKRAEWLDLSSFGLINDERLALASLGANLRLYTPNDGKILAESFEQLDTKNRQRWAQHYREQLMKQAYPSETYGPAIFNTAQKQTNLSNSIKAMIPLYNSVLDEEAKLRASHQLNKNLPVSFRELAHPKIISKLLKCPKTSYPIDIDLKTGIAKLKEGFTCNSEPQSEQKK